MERVSGEALAEEPREEDTPEVIPFKLQYSIEIPDVGIYVVKRPVGTVGSRHFTLMMRCLPSGYDSNGDPIYSPLQEERVFDSYEKWVATVLKHVIVSCPVMDGVQITSDTIPPEHQYMLFQAMGRITQGSSRTFRILDAKPKKQDPPAV